MSDHKTDPKQHDDLDYETTGHSWDGIFEYNKPLPRWWLYTFYTTIVWGVIWTILFPAWPGITGATAGILGYSTRAEVAESIATHEQALGPINAKLAAADLSSLSDDPELASYAQNAGAAVFRTWCAQCHGSGAAGAKGYPNLLDDDWLWGGSMEEIHTTITHGIRNEEDFDAHYSAMPAFGRDDLLERGDIRAVVNYVMSLSGTPNDASDLTLGQEVFIDNCASCHMENGTGDREQGAPNLVDAIWLYGGDYNTLYETVYNARFGVMPNWSPRLSDAEINAVTTYVHGLGGGE